MARAPQFTRFELLALLPLVLLFVGVRPCGAEALRVPYSAEALYNLGNAYARDGKPGPAVLNYERAQLLAPDDPDLAANLRAVRRLNGIDAVPRTGILDRVGRVNPDLCAWLGVAGLLLAGGATLAGRIGLGGIGRGRRVLRLAIIAAGIAAIMLPVVDAIVLWPAVHAAVVLAKTTPLRAAPVPLGDVLATLPEALTVHVKGEHEGFVLVQAPGGPRGWVSRADLGFVVP